MAKPRDYLKRLGRRGIERRTGFSDTAAVADRASPFASYDRDVGGSADNHALRVGFRMTW